MSDAVWTADTMRQRESEWQVTLSNRQVDELRHAVEQTMASQIPIASLTSEHFDLGTSTQSLSTLMRDIQQAVVDGRGFVLLRGIPVAEMSREAIVRAYVGLSTWLGTAVSQNGKGHLVGHVKDLGLDPDDPATRVYTTRYRQRFHTDSCDIVGLLCLQPARSGGASAIANSTAVFKELRRQRPDLAAVLQQPFVYDRKDEVPAGKQPTYNIPIAHVYKGKISVFYARDFIDAALQRFPDVAQLSPLQREALDQFDAMVGSDKFRLDMDFQPGDIQYLHNHQILHARTDYEDWPEAERKRHLIRLWLSAHHPRELPRCYEERYGPIVPGEIRGGIRVPGVEPNVPLDAV